MLLTNILSSRLKPLYSSYTSCSPLPAYLLDESRQKQGNRDREEERSLLSFAIMHPDGQHPRHSLRQRPVKSNSSLLLPCLVSMFLLSLLLLPSLVLGSSNETNSQPDVIQDRKGSILDHAIESVATQTASLIKSLKERRLANRKSIGLELLSPDEFTQFFSVLRGNSHKEKTTGQTKPISPMDSQTTAASGKPHRPQRQQQHLPPQSSGYVVSRISLSTHYPI